MEKQDKAVKEMGQEGNVKAENLLHPLNRRWKLWYNSPEDSNPKLVEWFDNVHEIATIETIEDFWRVFNNLKCPSELSNGSNYYLFQEGIQPQWEDPANKNGGKWIFEVSGGMDVDRQWLYMVLATIGDTLEGCAQITGVTVGVKKGKKNKVAVWTRDRSEADVNIKIATQMKKVLQLTNEINYHSHDSSLKRGISARDFSLKA